MAIATGHARGGRGRARLAHRPLPRAAARAAQRAPAEGAPPRKAAREGRRLAQRWRRRSRARLRLWAQKWRWYERNSLPWNRARIHWEFMRREAFVRWPRARQRARGAARGPPGARRGGAARAGRVDHRAGRRARAHRRGHFLNMGVMVAAQELVEIGEHCMLANGCFVSDASHRFDDPEQPITWQGFKSKGPTRIGANCWLGANVVVTSGVTHRRALRDRRQQRRHARHRRRSRSPPGAPAKVLRTRRIRVASGAPMDLYEAMRCAPTTGASRSEPVTPRDACCGRSTRPASRPAAATARAGA